MVHSPNKATPGSSCGKASGVPGTRPWPMGKAGRRPQSADRGPSGLGHGEGIRKKVRHRSSTHVCVGKKGVINHMTGDEPHKSPCALEGGATSLWPLPAGVKMVIDCI